MYIKGGGFATASIGGFEGSLTVGIGGVELAVPISNGGRSAASKDGHGTQFCCKCYDYNDYHPLYNWPPGTEGW